MRIIDKDTIKLEDRLFPASAVLNVYGYDEHGIYHTGVLVKDGNSALAYTKEGDRFDKIDAWWQKSKTNKKDNDNAKV